MEISNKALGIISATFIVFGISMRVQSGQSNPPPAAPSGLGKIQPKPIPDSDFNTLSQYNTIQQKPIDSKLGGTPNQALINLNQAGAIVPGVTKTEDDSKPASVTPPATEPETSDEDVDDASSQDASDSANIPPAPPAGNLSIMGAAVESLDSEDQAAFGMMWSTLTPLQRERLSDAFGKGHS